MSDTLTLIAPPPELAALGVPLWVTVASAPVPGATPAYANVQVDLSALAGVAGVQLVLDGYRFTSGPLIVPQRFTDAATLLAAIEAVPVLAATYTLSYAGQVVSLVATDYGWTPTASSTQPARALVTTTPASPALYSQQAGQYRWSCFLEIWGGCGVEFGGVTDTTQAQVLQRLTLDYRADNAYSFDVASALRQLTAHAHPAFNLYGDRLVSYFLRFGEEYATTAGGLKSPRTRYDSVVYWGLEAMQVPDPVPGTDLRLLTARPQPWRVAVGDLLPCGLLLPTANGAQLLARTRLATTRTTTDTVIGGRVDTGQVRQGRALNVPAGTLSGAVCLSAERVVTPLVQVEFGATGQRLRFVNRQGSDDTVYFSGTPDDTGKRTSSTYTNAAGQQNISADNQTTRRLYSGLLDFATWDWLRQELAVSPAAWLETATGALPYTIADMSADGDEVSGNYSLYVDLQPPVVRGLSN